MVIKVYIYCLLNDKKVLKKFCLRTWYTKKLSGYRVIQPGYSLMSCLEQDHVLTTSNIIKCEILCCLETGL